MKHILKHKHIIKQNLLSILGISLFLYFSYHAVMGDRGFIKYISLQSQIEVAQNEQNELLTERKHIENKVVKLRPSTLDSDLLEERARLILGYVRRDEALITNVN